jgi:hypothetical protein
MKYSSTNNLYPEEDDKDLLSGGDPPKDDTSVKKDGVGSGESDVKEGGVNPGTVNTAPTTTTVTTTPVTAFNPYSVSYQEAQKKDANLKWADWANGANKYRQENGLSPVSWEEVITGLKGHDPQVSEEEREKAERRLRRAERLNAIGSFLVNLVNYARTKTGHMNMNLSDTGKSGQQRIDLLREYNRKLDRQGYEDYLGALARDEAQRSQEQARKQAQDNYEKQQARAQANWEAEFGLNMRKLNLAEGKEESDKEKDRKKEEREDKLTDAKIRYYNRGGSRGNTGGSKGDSDDITGSFTTHDGKTYIRKKPISAQEAYSLLDSYGGGIQAFNDSDAISKASQLLTQGKVPEKVIKGMKFKLSTDEKPAGLGWGDTSAEDEIDW